jgi:hypothetical protein
MTSSVTDVVVDPADSSKWYMGVEGDGVYPFADTGVVGTKLSIPASGIDRISLAISPTDSSVMYAAFTSSSTFTFNAAGAGIFVTTTGPTGTWSAFTTATGYKNDTNGLFVFPWYALQLQVDATQSSTLYVASGPGLGKFTNSGASLTNPTGNRAHADFHALAYAGSRLWMGTDGGVYSTDDAFTTVQNRNSNLALTQFEPGASASTGGVLSGGTQDNGSNHTGTLLDWTQLPLGCDGGWGDVSATAPTDFIFTPQSGCAGYFVARSQSGGLAHADSGINGNETGLFYAPIVAAPTDPNVLYYGRTHLWSTTNRGGSWTSYGTQTFGSSISSIGASTSANTVYVGTKGGHIFSSGSNGSAGPWTDVAMPAYVTDIVVDPNDVTHAYASVSGFGHDHVYETTNSGTNWNSISSTMDVDAPANGIAVDWRSGKGQVYVATDVGTFVSDDDGATWADATPGMPRVIAMDVLVDTSMDRLVVFTHGRGVWAAALGTNPPDTSIAGGPSPLNSTSVSFSLSANPSSGATFQCKLDDQAFETCSSNPSYTGLSLGVQHTFQARAISSTGSDQTPAIAQWTIDTTPPDTSITSKPAASTADTTAQFEFASTESGSTFGCSLDGAAVQPCGAAQSFSVALGDHEIVVAATDHAGNTDPTPASYAWQVSSAPAATTPTTTTTTTTTTSSTPQPSTGTGTGPPPPTAASVSCAIAKLKSLSARKLRKGVKVTIRCKSPAKAQLVVKLGKKVIATGRGPISAAGAVKLRGSKKALASARRGKLRLTAVFSAPGATTQRVTLKLKLTA